LFLTSAFSGLLIIDGILLEQESGSNPDLMRHRYRPAGLVMDGFGTLMHETSEGEPELDRKRNHLDSAGEKGEDALIGPVLAMKLSPLSDEWDTALLGGSNTLSMLI